MSNYPRKDRRAKTGSNLRGQPLLVHRRNELIRDAELHDRLAREHHRESAKLFSKKDLRLISKIAGQVQSEWRQASVKVGGDSARVDTLEIAARKKFERLLAREFPNYAKWRAMRRAHLREHRKLSAAALASVPTNRNHVAWGDLSATLAGGQDFSPPFTVFDVQNIDHDGFIVRDESFANPDTGHLVNSFDFDQDENTSFSFGLFGLLWPGVAANRASCGVAYTMPSAGRLQVSAVLRNFYDNLMYSVHDKFGFSSAEVYIFLRLFIAVVRGNHVTFLPTMLRSTGMISHGGKLSYAESELDNSVPYTVAATTEERLNADESVFVLAGSEVHIESLLDDMRCKVNAVLWWQLQKLTIGVIDDIGTTEN